MTNLLNPIRWQPLAAAASLAVLVACNSGQPPTPKPTTSGMSYVNPSSEGFCLVKQTGSTPERLVLGLQGPNGTAIRGALVSLTVDGAKATWAPLDSTSYVQNGGALDLGTGLPLLRGNVSGSTLEAAAFQKGSTPAAALGQNPVLRVALALKAGAASGPVSFAGGTVQILDADGKTQTLPLAVGTLSVE
jgi:hypothetical protein